MGNTSRVHCKNIEYTLLTSISSVVAVYYFCNGITTFTGVENEKEILVDICRKGKVDTPGCIGKMN